MDGQTHRMYRFIHPCRGMQWHCPAPLPTIQMMPIFKKCNPSYRLHLAQTWPQSLKICLEKYAATSRISRFSATLATLCMMRPQQQKSKSKYGVSFLQLEKNKAKTGLNKLLTPTLSVFLAGQWAVCEDGLCGNEAYENCMLANGSWLPIQKVGVYRETNIGKGIKRRQAPAAAVVTSLVPFQTNVYCFLRAPARHRARPSAFLLFPPLLRKPPEARLFGCLHSCSTSLNSLSSLESLILGPLLLALNRLNAPIARLPDCPIALKNQSVLRAMSMSAGPLPLDLRYPASALGAPGHGAQVRLSLSDRYPPPA